jgi:hypothetical protein
MSKIPLTCNSIDELNNVTVERANETFDLENNDFAIDDLFNASHNLLTTAANYRQVNDYERCYAYLVQYLVLVMKKMNLHPDIGDYQSEYEIAKQQCEVVKSDLTEIKKILNFLYETKEQTNSEEVANTQVDFDDYQQQQQQQEENSFSSRRTVRVNHKLMLKKITPLPGIQMPQRIITSSSTNKEWQPPRRYNKGRLIQTESRQVVPQYSYQSTSYPPQQPQLKHQPQHVITPQTKSVPPIPQHVQQQYQQQKSQHQQQQYQYEYVQPQYVQQAQYIQPTYSHPQQQQQYQQHYVEDQQINEVALSTSTAIPAMFVQNEVVQQKVGQGVARLAQNEQVQQRVADGVSNAAQDRNVQHRVGTMIAQNSDNYLVQQAAQNEQLQKAMGTAVAKTIGNREVQKKIGDGVANLATNKQVQKKVANGFLSAGKFGFSATKTIAKSGYDIYKTQQQEQ